MLRLPLPSCVEPASLSHWLSDSPALLPSRSDICGLSGVASGPRSGRPQREGCPSRAGRHGSEAALPSLVPLWGLPTPETELSLLPRGPFHRAHGAGFLLQSSGLQSAPGASSSPGGGRQGVPGGQGGREPRCERSGRGRGAWCERGCLPRGPLCGQWEARTGRWGGAGAGRWAEYRGRKGRLWGGRQSAVRRHGRRGSQASCGSVELRVCSLRKPLKCPPVQHVCSVPSFGPRAEERGVHQGTGELGVGGAAAPAGGGGVLPEAPWRLRAGARAQCVLRGRGPVGCWGAEVALGALQWGKAEQEKHVV